MDDSKEFSVVGVVVSLCWEEQLGKVGTWMPVAVGVILEEDGA